MVDNTISPNVAAEATTAVAGFGILALIVGIVLFILQIAILGFSIYGMYRFALRNRTVTYPSVEEAEAAKSKME